MNNKMLRLNKKISESVNFIKSKYSRIPKCAIIFGTGLADATLKLITPELEIPYIEIPYFNKTNIKTHQGKMVFTNINGVEVILMLGRIHFYEGYSIDEVVYPIHILKELGVQTIFITSSVGGINSNLSRGDLILLKDHINLTSINPLRGYDNSFGKRFLPCSNIYDLNLRNKIKNIALEQNIELKEGVMFFLPGPTFETNAEFYAISQLGADSVGWSTIPEALVAHYRGMKVLAVNCVTDSINISDSQNDLEDIIHIAQDSGKKIFTLLFQLIPKV